MLRTWYLITGFAFYCFVPAIFAQNAADDKSDSAAIAAAAAEADTGRMMPGYGDLSRYDTPGYCLGAMSSVQAAVWRAGEGDTIERESAGDTIPRAAIEIGKKCSSRMTADNVPEIELYNLMRLSILIGDTAKLRSVVNRQLALASTPASKGYVLLDAIDELLSARVIHRSMAMDLLKDLDALGHEARLPRLDAHNLVRRDAYSPRFDLFTVMQESHAIMALEQSLTPAERKEYQNGLGSIYQDSIYALWYQRIPNLTEEVHRLMARRIDETPEWQLTEMQRAAFLGRMDQLSSAIGKDATLTADFAFPDSTAARITPGKVTLLMAVSKGYSGLMTGQLAMLRRMYDKYNANGFEVILIVRTEGYSWASPPQSPEDEARVINWFFRDHLQLPFPVLVQETEFRLLPDGRRVSQGIAFMSQYPTPHVLVGKDGRVHTLYIGVGTEAELDAFIRQALEL